MPVAMRPDMLFRHWRGLCWGGACGLLGLVLVLASPAEAFDENPRLWGKSSDPYQKVGKANKELTALCRSGLFNQRKIGEYFIGFNKDLNGAASSDLIGIAKKNYNLYDPQGKADAAKTYHFHNDGTSQCRVYVAP